MIAADGPNRARARLLVLEAGGAIRVLPRHALAELFRAGDLVVANDAATLPASLQGIHAASGEAIEVRLAGWLSPGDPSRFAAIVFGPGDHRTRTEDRPFPPALAPGDRLTLDAFDAEIARLLDHPRLIELTIAGGPNVFWAGIARHGRPIQYAHVPQRLALWDVWTAIAANPFAFEPPSAGFALDWPTLHAWRSRGVVFATVTHAAGISSTGDPLLDRRLPFDEPFYIPDVTTAAVGQTKAQGGRIVAIGTTAVRALEAAARDGTVRAGDGWAAGRIGSETRLKVVDAILSGVHEAGESHYELLRAFAPGEALARMGRKLEAGRYRSHEFGDSVLIERQRGRRATASPRR
jgi:S-adenosylmethionine:tRNA ribosyltransferase-isomerase